MTAGENMINFIPAQWSIVAIFPEDCNYLLTNTKGKFSVDSTLYSNFLREGTKLYGKEVTVDSARHNNLYWANTTMCACGIA